MRLIDADRLLTDRMKSKYYHLPNGDTAIPIIDIEHAPTIDAVEVVRCKDCIFYEKALSVQGFCHAHGSIVSANAFCSYSSYGEHKEDGEDEPI